MLGRIGRMGQIHQFADHVFIPFIDQDPFKLRQRFSELIDHRVEQIAPLQILDLFFTDLFPHENSRHQAGEYFKLLPEGNFRDHSVQRSGDIAVDDLQSKIHLFGQFHPPHHFLSRFHPDFFRQPFLIS